jgi:hypothetical protein
MKELKPCPFCGRAMYLDQRKNKMYYIEGWHKPNCILYYAKLPPYNIPDVAIIQWNRRADPDEKTESEDEDGINPEEEKEPGHAG